MQIESEVIFMKFGHEILKYRDDILRDLAKLIAGSFRLHTPSSR